MSDPQAASAGLADAAMEDASGAGDGLVIPSGGNKAPQRGMKKKAVKGTKASGVGGTPAAAAGKATKKKKIKDEVMFDPKDLSQPLPLNFHLYCKSFMTGRYHRCKILDRRMRDEKFKIYSVPWPQPKYPPLPVVEGVQPDFTDHTHIYYIHYIEWDRRMDEWVYRDRLALPFQVPLLQPAAYNLATAEENALHGPPGSTGEGGAAGGAGGKEKKEDDDEEGDDDEPAAGEAKQKKGKSKMEGDGADGGKGGKVSGKDAAAVAAAAAASGELIPGGDPHGGSLGGHGNFSEEDIKAHEEATKVKNIESIVLGSYHMSTWYYSPLPSECNAFNVLHFCEFCLNFFGYEEELKRHSKKCLLRHPPGNEIYRSQEKNVEVSVWEVDGAREKNYCQNLCYIAKLFLDHKTLEYDCTPFLFYIFCEVDEYGYHIVGYFSKEKISQSKYNLACILTLPCHQRKGYGKLIISLSYELSKIEEKVGSPEKPISDLGKVSYMSYWSSTLLEVLRRREWTKFGEPENAISVEGLSRMTSITVEDIQECLKSLHILIWYKGKWVFSETALNQALKEREEKKAELAKKIQDPNAIFVSQCRPERLHWTPFFATNRDKSVRKQ